MNKANQYKIRRGDLTAMITPFGASLASLEFKGQQLLRRLPIKDYPSTGGHFGSIAGPIANRISGAQVEINGERHQLPVNDGAHTLHGGPLGLGRRDWSIEEHDQSAVTLILKLVDGELGLPGDRVFRCHYSISNEQEVSSLNIKLTMISNKDTMCNLAPHPYFCLDDSGSTLDHELTIFADHYLPTNQQCLPTGEVAAVEETRYDFRSGQLLRALDDEGLMGFDHNFCLVQSIDQSGLKRRGEKKVARLYSRLSKVSMSVTSNQVGIQIYTPMSLGEPLVDEQRSRQRYPAICLEPQSWPDSPHHENFPSISVTSGQTYEHLTRFAFSHHS